jgi:ParB/RepB/Spo0J family partition protein
MIVYAPLDRIDDNPFQTRLVYDPTAIQELADSLRQLRPSMPDTRGLVHVPPARGIYPGRIPEVVKAADFERVRFQLAAGHSRLRAFRLLAEEDPDAWHDMPLEVTELTDDAMADIIWQENARRKNLSAVEEAAALRMAIARFGYTQQEVGDRWGLSQSAVANKLRLLELPEEAQAAIRTGAITERHGRALLSAQAKSPVLYERLAATVLPLPAPAPDVLERAQSLYTEGQWYEIHPHTDCDYICSACGAAINVSANRTVFISNPRVGEPVYLCHGCQRAATNWQPPTSAQVERQAEQLAAQVGKRLRDAIWPLDFVVGRGDPRVHNDHCDRCDRRVVSHADVWTGDLCLDPGCFAAKQQNWTGYLQGQIRAALRDDGHPVRIMTESTGGADLCSYSAGDVLLVRSGKCRACEHSRFRLTTSRDRCLCPSPDLPFIYNCDNGNRQRACSKRADEQLRTDDEKQAKAADAVAIQARRDEGHRQIAAAERIVAQALADDNADAWYQMAKMFGGMSPDRLKGTKGNLSLIRLAIAGYLLGRQIYEPTWSDREAVGRVSGQLEEKSALFGVPLVAKANAIAARLDRLERWLDANPQPNPTLAAQNRDNLHKWLEEATGALARQEIDGEQFHELSGRIAVLAARLQSISQEIEDEETPLPCIWDDGAEDLVPAGAEIAA